MTPKERCTRTFTCALRPAFASLALRRRCIPVSSSPECHRWAPISVSKVPSSPRHALPDVGVEDVNEARNPLWRFDRFAFACLLYCLRAKPAPAVCESRDLVRVSVEPVQPAQYRLRGPLRKAPSRFSGSNSQRAALLVQPVRNSRNAGYPPGVYEAVSRLPPQHAHHLG